MHPFAAFAGLLLAQAAPLPPSDLTLPPETAHTVLIVEGRGTQNYTCSAQMGTHYAWSLPTPEAQLFNLATGKSIGHHDAGPTWTLDDGSSVHGTKLAQKPADAPADVPWLLLRAEPANPAAPAPGTLAPVTLVRRYNTHGGTPPPTGCDASHVGITLKVPYSATYAFYTVSGESPLSAPPLH